MTTTNMTVREALQLAYDALSDDTDRTAQENMALLQDVRQKMKAALSAPAEPSGRPHREALRDLCEYFREMCAAARRDGKAAGVILTFEHAEAMVQSSLDAADKLLAAEQPAGGESPDSVRLCGHVEDNDGTIRSVVVQRGSGPTLCLVPVAARDQALAAAEQAKQRIEKIRKEWQPVSEALSGAGDMEDLGQPVDYVSELREELRKAEAAAEQARADRAAIQKEHEATQARVEEKRKRVRELAAENDTLAQQLKEARAGATDLRAAVVGFINQVDRDPTAFVQKAHWRETTLLRNAVMRPPEAQPAESAARADFPELQQIVDHLTAKKPQPASAPSAEAGAVDIEAVRGTLSRIRGRVANMPVHRLGNGFVVVDRLGVYGIVDDEIAALQTPAPACEASVEFYYRCYYGTQGCKVHSRDKPAPAAPAPSAPEPAGVDWPIIESFAIDTAYDLQFEEVVAAVRELCRDAKARRALPGNGGGKC